VGRRIYIISKSEKITQVIRNQAEASNCPEIVWGVPPALKGVIDEVSLPVVFEEPEQSIVNPRNILEELDELKHKVDQLQGTKSVL